MKLDERLREIGGCTDGNCIVVKRTGQHTNGGCRCSRDPYKMQQVIHAYKTALTAIEGKTEWCFVPPEITKEMAHALESNIAECLPPSEVHRANWADAYKKMLSVVPAPPREEK